MVKTIADEIRECTERMKALVALAQREDRDLSESEDKEFKELQSKVDALDKKRSRAEGFDSILKNVETMAAKANGGGPSPIIQPHMLAGLRTPLGGILPFIGSGKISLGQAFVESEAFKVMQAMPRSGTWQSPTIEVDAAVTIVPSTAIPPGTIVVPPAPVWPFDLVSARFAQGTTDAGAIPYLQETLFTNAADYVAVGTPKPESAKVYTLASATLLKLAHIINVPDEFLDDVAGLRSYIDANMTGGLIAKLEHEVVNGVGGAGKIMGLIPLPGKTADFPAAANEPLAASIAKAAAAVWTTARRRPDTVVLNPTTFVDVTMQTSPAFFLFPPGSPLAGLTPVQSPEVPAGQAVVGSFLQGSMLFRKGGIALQATNSHDANFASNITTIRAEMRVVLVHFVPQCYSLVTGLTLPVVTP